VAVACSSHRHGGPGAPGALGPVTDGMGGSTWESPVLAATVRSMPADEVAAAFQASPLFRELEEIAESGEFGRFESGAKRHHFVPQMLLRGLRPKDGQSSPTFPA
jgi:hypothetical protein